MMYCKMEDNDCNHHKSPLYDKYPFALSMMIHHLSTWMETMESSSSNQPCLISITDPGPSKPCQLLLAEPSMICPEQQDLPVAFPDSQPFKPTARQSDVIVTYIDCDNSAVSPIFDDATVCYMGQLLQLGLPSGCSSQSLVHNNTEPSVRIGTAPLNLVLLFLTRKEF